MAGKNQKQRETNQSTNQGELERARAHLRSCQKILADERLAYARPPFWYPYKTKRGAMWLRIAERNVLAALSWLWDVQERFENQSFPQIDAKAVQTVENGLPSYLSLTAQQWFDSAYLLGGVCD